MTSANREPPVLTPAQAEEALNAIYARFTLPENRLKLTNLVEECNKAENPLVAKMTKFPPLVTSLLSDLMEGYGFDPEKEIMAGITQIQLHAAKNAGMQGKVGILMQAFMGNIPAEEGMEEAEECD